MANSKFIEAYKKYYIDRDYEQLELFELLANKFSITRVLYPGCYVHITPSFIFPDVTYVDNDKMTRKLMIEKNVISYIIKRKRYSQKPTVIFYPQSYTTEIEEPKGSYDLLISIYAGFISKHCKEYLKSGGLLLVNNSHGDAGLAFLDPEFVLMGVINRRKDSFVFSDKNLNEYFIPKKPQKISEEILIKLKRGIGYTKTANLYLFKKV